MMESKARDACERIEEYARGLDSLCWQYEAFTGYRNIRSIVRESLANTVYATVLQACAVALLDDAVGKEDVAIAAELHTRFRNVYARLVMAVTIVQRRFRRARRGHVASFVSGPVTSLPS